MANEKRLIDANALTDLIIANFQTATWDGASSEECQLALDTIDEAETVDAVEVVRARWVDNHCTACGMMPMGEELWKHMDIAPPRMECFMDYCPCCGAKMDR